MKKTARKRWLTAMAAGITVFLLLAIFRGGFTAEDPAERWRIICDALFVPGILLMAFGLLLFASRGGVFDMLRFGVQKVIGVILPRKKREALPRTFYDYKTEREGREQIHMGYLLAVGMVFILLAGLALVMYNQFELPC